MTTQQPSVRTPAPRGNGNLETPPPPAQTPEELAVAHGIASYQQLRSERDALQKRVDQMEQLLSISKIEIEGLRAESATHQSRTEGYQLERDSAVIDLTVYQSLFTAVLGLLRTFGIENAPLVKKITLPHDREGDNDPAT